MARRYFNNYKRKRGSRKQKPIILIITTRKNVTESQYFKSFQKKNSECNIKILILGQLTDLLGMQERIERFWKENDMDEKKGDLAYIVLNLDCDAEKVKLIKQLSEQITVSKFVVSNSDFEMWFLLHFRYSIKGHHSSIEVVKDLRNCVSGHEKNTDVGLIIEKSLSEALKNAIF